MRKPQFQLALFGDVDDIGNRRSAIAIQRNEHVDVPRLAASQFQANRLVDRINQGRVEGFLTVFRDKQV